MGTQRAAGSLAVVEVTRFRGHDPEYHAYVQLLIGAVLDEAAAQGWSVSRLAADQGTDALLARTETADAIVVVGGEDIHPQFYGATGGYAAASRHLPTADAAQLALVRRAIARETPFLGICRGLQILNVALGGTLVQHLGDESTHRNDGAPISGIMTTHPVELSAGSRAARLLGASVVDARSAHHQAVDAVGDGLVVTGRAPDGQIEAVEHRTAPVIGVQWHPEAPGAPSGQLAALLSGLTVAARAERAA